MRAAPLLQPVRQTPAMQAMQANLPPAKNTSGNRAIVPKQSTGPVRRMLEPVNGGLPETASPTPVSRQQNPAVNIDPKRAAGLANIQATPDMRKRGLPGTQIPSPPPPSNQQGGSGTGTGASTGGGLITPQPKTTSQPTEPTQQTVGGYPNNGSQAPAIPPVASGSEIPPAMQQTDVPPAPQMPTTDYQTAQVDPNASVAQQLNSLLSADNPYLQQARLRAEQEAASRGLRNSTLGVQAGEQAAIAAALPIAQQEAGQQFDLQKLSEQQKATAARDAILNAYQGQRDTRLNAMDLNRLAEQQKITERRDQLLNQMQNNRDTRLFAMDMQKLQQNFENDLGKMGVEMSHQNRIAYTNSASALINSAMEQVSAIYQNPNMDVAQQRNAVRQVYQDLNSRFSALADIYQPLPGVDFEQPQQ